MKEWLAAFTNFRNAKALIVDIRLNSGGDSGIGYQILQTLAQTPFLTARQTMRTYNPTERARGASLQFTEIDAQTIEPQKENTFSGPVIVLAGPATFSAAEDFLVAWKNSGRGKVMGESSGGSTGQPLFFTLPGGGSARVCTKHDTFPDGTEWVGKGIEPDILVRPTLADVSAGRDTVLEKAIDYFSNVQQNSPGAPGSTKSVTDH